MGASNDLSSQWQNPKDILSLLLLIGGDIVQKAIAQLFGVYVELVEGGPRIYLTPVAFSFGWVGYAFISLTSVVGDKQLMPSDAETQAIVINCSSGYSRTNRSWLLARIIRDHELNVEDKKGPEYEKLKDPWYKKTAGLPQDAEPPFVSLRIDIFDLEGESGPSIDFVWALSWLTIAAQLGFSIIPLALYDDWAIFLVTAAGTLLALLTGSLRQWNREKWPGRRLNKSEKRANNRLDKWKKQSTSAMASSDPEGGTGVISRFPPVTPSSRQPQPDLQSNSNPREKIVCLTRGGGYRYAMILRCSKLAWDLETLATATSESLPETSWCLVGLAALWICLLISVSGLQSNTWYLLLIGGVGMLQNIYVASARRDPAALGLKMKPYEKRKTIIGSQVDENEFWLKPSLAEPPDDELVREGPPYLEPWKTAAVRGAIRELEKTIPKAGMALMPEFFPALLRMEKERYRDAKETRFWQLMFDNRFPAAESPTTDEKAGSLH
ncbi:uncharacterized protein PV07_03885 [Cladophialophora immunda]|uniref:Uncharacterized protein n=1 Tax=Cladophialophora immunda TaxID=569365 RepID=A0A0D1ZVX6_9EURO|nr:uncharacterized protein PV07_03885 [Cladophialophora immunda]KIW32331.1 hypothetical protein PV07_03885 [Cladophialophora immunda]